MPVIGGNANEPCSILVRCSERHPSADLYSVGLKEEIPSFALPLRTKEQPIVSLQKIFAQIYNQARCDYQQPLPRH